MLTIEAESVEPETALLKNQMPNSGHCVHVAVAVIVDARQRILIALRPEGVHQGGLWEFPGGKVEPGETVQQALSREISEELGLRVTDSRPLIKIQHDYNDKSVLLDVCWVDQFDGVAEGREGQPICWVGPEDLSHYHFPAANQSIVAAVQAELMNSR
jgi:8-oxo-dGTP diphosphatase